METTHTISITEEAWDLNVNEQSEATYISAGSMFEQTTYVIKGLHFTKLRNLTDSNIRYYITGSD